MLIGLTGKARSGKDTVANYLRDRHGFEVLTLARPLKHGLQAMLGLTEEHTDGELKEQVIDWLGVSTRELMQTLGTEWGRTHVASDVWLRVLARNYEKIKDRNVVVSDIRFENEAEWVRRQGGWVVSVQREIEGVRPHESENGISHCDLTIENSGTIDYLHWLCDALVLFGDESIRRQVECLRQAI